MGGPGWGSPLYSGQSWVQSVCFVLRARALSPTGVLGRSELISRQELALWNLQGPKMLPPVGRLTPLCPSLCSTGVGHTHLGRSSPTAQHRVTTTGVCSRLGWRVVGS